MKNIGIIFIFIIACSNKEPNNNLKIEVRTLNTNKELYILSKGDIDWINLNPTKIKFKENITNKLMSDSNFYFNSKMIFWLGNKKLFELYPMDVSPERYRKSKLFRASYRKGVFWIFSYDTNLSEVESERFIEYIEKNNLLNIDTVM